MAGVPLRCLCLCLALSRCLSHEISHVSGLYSSSPQRLSMYTWFGNARLFRFRVPEGAELVRWSLTVTRGSGFNCGDQNITVHFRSGAPPVINPIGTAFPDSTAFSLAFNLTVSVSSAQSGSVTLFNLTRPADGDWFIAAHLPKDNGKIQQQGLPSCSYSLQPQMYVRRAVDTPILQTNIPLAQTLTQQHVQYRVFVPEFSSELGVFLQSCSVQTAPVSDCSLSITLGSASLGRSSAMVVNCSGGGPCSASLPNPPWNTWVRVSLDFSQANVSTAFSICANYTVGCAPPSVESDVNVSFPLSASSLAAPLSNSCLRTAAVLRETQDVFSVRFTVANGSVTAPALTPTLLPLELESADSGGALILQLDLNTTSVIGPLASVRACLTPSAPVLQLNTSQSCDAAFMTGYPLQVSVNETRTLLRIPFPRAVTWYLSLQSICNDSAACVNVSAAVGVSASVSACVDECGPYGDCKLLRSQSYLYAACVCNTGWLGWSCSDGSSALSFSRQLAAALLLTLSNLLFLPPIVVALYRGYHPEAIVYLLTMFFSTFYHACDQPGVTVLCIMDYDTLQFCDFLGSVVAVWVTIVCMARLQYTLKYVLFMGGTLLIAMAMQLDRRGLWNLLGPVLFALAIMLTAWIYRSVKRRHCYPPAWKRWVFFLIPGIASAVIGLCVYAFAQTDSNYYYTHSIWHIMVATSVVFLLPPREDNVPPWGWPRKLCGYRMCLNQETELHVTP
ncbi:post-GPI attachment to proteins factor 6 isoform 2-T2 [Clarias gariepinus]|uniref:post-GPI attachment to proteins factor 6 isoform X2 n=1 Tax=Clarias gariepinus TaxID=13013 RepID=UPI00234E1D3A|nr:post-GPI attachment to proteins factor 6 isoform X2 [Clarias gariepinus]